MEIQYTECFAQTSYSLLDHISAFLSLCLLLPFSPHPLHNSLANPMSIRASRPRACAGAGAAPRVTLRFIEKPPFQATDGPSEIAGKFFTSGRHGSYNSAIQRRPLGRMGMSRYASEQCAIAGREARPPRERDFFFGAAISQMLPLLRDDGRE